MVEKGKPSLEDIIGIEYSKLGFFREAQEKIAQLRASTEELSRKKQQIEAIFNAIVDIIMVIDLDFKIISVNNSFLKYFQNREPVGKFCYKLIKSNLKPCENCPAINAKEKNLLLKKEEVFKINGEELVFEITASPIIDNSGKPVNILIVKRDITAEKKYQRKYLEAEKMATIGILAAGIAHEINNPLTAIYGFAQGAKRRLKENFNILSNEFAENLEFNLNIILEECKRCQEIIQSLLTYSRESPSKFIDVNLNKIILDALPIIKHRIEGDKKRSLSVELSKNLKNIKGNIQQLRQLVFNLLLNAIDATEDGGEIKIITRNFQSKVLVKICDTGKGISEENLTKIFDPFFTTKKVGKGTGLGLTICYNIVKMHGAEIKVESKAGKSTKFTVIFQAK